MGRFAVALGFVLAWILLACARRDEPTDGSATEAVFFTPTSRAREGPVQPKGTETIPNLIARNGCRNARETLMR